ncbi:hypothetical protein [Caulobacter phage Cr30]|uniref:hypothetical protein n=1 Tax=Caulobacter phage Cr30 TaxID=1357714 RepID=UPI0004A9B5A7|nr:hypothetical protein OZ74_gp039 [Caulobacter phage Cr30]AGS80924.1 hypothetical protein [Caulobacter phage Cr30]
MFKYDEYKILGKLKLVHSYEPIIDWELSYEGDKRITQWYFKYGNISIHPFVHDNFHGTKLSAIWMRFTKFFFEPIHIIKKHSGTKEYGFVFLGVWFTIFLDGFEMESYNDV